MKQTIIKGVMPLEIKKGMSVENWCYEDSEKCHVRLIVEEIDMTLGAVYFTIQKEKKYIKTPYNRSLGQRMASFFCGRRLSKKIFIKNLDDQEKK